MKTLTKIILLAVCLFVAISGVMIYAKTRVEPPVATKQGNQYMKDLQASRDAICTAGTMAQKDSILENTLDRMQTFYYEEKINSDETDAETQELLKTYIPLFDEDAQKKFSNNVWYEVDHRRMLNVIAELRKVTYTNRSSALSKSQNESLSQIEEIVTDYRRARNVSRHTTYNGIQDAKNSIKDAQKFLKDPWLSNCTSLVSALKKVKPSIAASHYRYVTAKIEELSQYRYYGKDFYFNTLVPSVDNVIRDYEYNAKELYGSARETVTLRTKATNYRNTAKTYYNE